MSMIHMFASSLPSESSKSSFISNKPYDEVLGAAQFTEHRSTGCPKKRGISVWQAVEGIRSGLKTTLGWVLKNSGNFLSNEHKNSPFLCKTAKKNEVKHAYPSWRNDIILGVDSCLACNSMKILIDNNLILITMDRKHHVKSYHRSVKVHVCTFLSS